MKKMTAFLVTLCMLAALLAGCGGASKSPQAFDAAAPAAAAPAEAANGAYYDMESAKSEDGGLTGDTDSTVLPEGRKWIITVNMSAETEDLDSLMETLNGKISGLGGYVEDQDSYNGSMYSSRRYRSASLTVRIPAERVDEFTEEMSGIANVVSTNLSREDITLSYVATESRVKALQTEEARLLELMEQAETMADLLEIESRLTDVRYELENRASQLRLYDNQVDYATIYLSIDEVQEYTPVEEPTVWERISGGFVSSIKGVGNGLLDLLVWVLVLANCMSVLIQYQSAKLGIVTGKSLPEILGERLGDAGRFMFFMQAEVIAIATDLAEVIGGAIALNLLFGLPLFIGGLVIGAISTVMLWFQGGKTQTTFERIIIVMLLIITFGFIAGLFVAPPNPGEVVKGMIPRFQGADSVLMAASILGATVMPHAIYLHSTLVNDHYAGGEKPSIKTQLKGSKIDVAWALLLAGTVNLAMLVLAANSLHGMSGTDSIDGAQRAIAQVLGPVIGTIFSIGLLASSLSSTSVGTYAGSEIMHGLLHVNAPMWACRVVTLVPALIVLWFAKDPTQALVIGQMVLSIGIPFAVIPLMRYTHDKELMGKWADGTVKHVIFMIVVALIVALNVLLIVLTLMGRA